jgi:hypothetical protein
VSFAVGSLIANLGAGEEAKSMTNPLIIPSVLGEGVIFFLV